MSNNLTKAKYMELQASIFGACFVAFGLGVILFSFFEKYAFIIITIGIIIHAWGMYKIHQRNKK